MRYILLLQSLQERKKTIKEQIKCSEDFRGIMTSCLYIYIYIYIT